MSTPDFCPSCGYNFKADTPITLGPWQLHPTVVLLAGHRPALTVQEASMAHTIARFYPRPVPVTVLLNRCTGSVDESVVRVVILRARHKLALLFGEPVIETVKGAGYTLSERFYNQGLHTPE